MDAADVRLTFPAKAGYLLLARLALTGLSRAYPFAPEQLADLKLAVTEACGNAVRHAYVEADGQITVTFRVSEERLEMSVEDRGSGLEVPASGTWTMPEHFEGGMGMAIIRETVDELDVTRGEDGRGTVVRMTKYLAT